MGREQVLGSRGASIRYILQSALCLGHAFKLDIADKGPHFLLMLFGTIVRCFASGAFLCGWVSTDDTWMGIHKLVTSFLSMPSRDDALSVLGGRQCILKRCHAMTKIPAHDNLTVTPARAAEPAPITSHISELISIDEQQTVLSDARWRRLSWNSAVMMGKCPLQENREMEPTIASYFNASQPKERHR